MTSLRVFGLQETWTRNIVAGIRNSTKRLRFEIHKFYIRNILYNIVINQKTILVYLFVVKYVGFNESSAFNGSITATVTLRRKWNGVPT